MGRTKRRVSKCHRDTLEELEQGKFNCEKCGEPCETVRWGRKFVQGEPPKDNGGRYQLNLSGVKYLFMSKPDKDRELIPKNKLAKIGKVLRTLLKELIVKYEVGTNPQQVNLLIAEVIMAIKTSASELAHYKDRILTDDEIVKNIEDFVNR